MIQIVYEDEYCVIVNKPSNTLVHHSAYARNLKDEKSLLELLKSHSESILYPVHRLDYKTSGLLLLCKNLDEVSKFPVLWEDNLVEKHYFALVRGFVKEQGEQTTPVKNERGNYKDAHSSYVPLEWFELQMPLGAFEKCRYTIVQFFPHTGRTNQLRIHANKMSHPIIGDPKFGDRHHNHLFQNELQIPYLFLHAERLKFQHPFLQIDLEVFAERPAFWSTFESQVDKIILE